MLTITDPAFLVILSLSLIKSQTNGLHFLHTQLKTLTTVCGRRLRVNAKDLKGVLCLFKPLARMNCVHMVHYLVKTSTGLN